MYWHTPIRKVYGFTWRNSFPPFSIIAKSIWSLLSSLRKFLWLLYKIYQLLLTLLTCAAIFQDSNKGLLKVTSPAFRTGYRIVRPYLNIPWKIWYFPGWDTPLLANSTVPPIWRSPLLAWWPPSWRPSIRRGSTWRTLSLWAGRSHGERWLRTWAPQTKFLWASISQ